MKFVIIWKKKSMVKLLKRCNSQDLIIIGITILSDVIQHLAEEKNISEESSKAIINELLNEKMFSR